ncbi:MAG: phenylalanine--tRNA ligase subunit beta [Bdellovibrionales bacterium]|nr:phenylalanine--tRNA ligase subunit beta [Bdellovibrionales bacterium]
MRISLKWLSNYVDVAEFFNKPEELDRLLTSVGLEVESVENQAEAFKNIVVGKIVEKGQHPDADKLSVCMVDIGAKESQQIICGASNHKQGDHVVVALPGANLPGDFSIKKSKIRGVESHGMLCSLSELGFADSSEGIIILPQEAPVGKAYTEYAMLNDVVYDISITPNRPDCLSHIGVAREVSAVLGRPLNLPVVEFSKVKGKTENLAIVELISNDQCLRYCGRGITGVKVGPSPEWLRQAVESVGMNSINNIVDITNYVMLETGQPLHVFDANEIGGKKIIIDQSKNGETFTTLDGTELKLTGHELMIRDGQRPVALAGIVGGLNSGVTEKTSTIFLEAAHFTTQAVRKTARKFKIDTESGFRFARGTDPEAVVRVMNRACQLIEQVAGGEVCETYIDHYPHPVALPKIEISMTYLQERLGYEPSESDFKMWLERLEMKVLNQKGDVFMVEPPFFRPDIESDVDLVEEYARLNGYDKIPESFPELVHAPTDHYRSFVEHHTVCEALKAEGYLQALNYNFLGSEFQKEFLGDSATALSSAGLTGDVKEAVSILNPLSDETNSMRVSLLATLFKNLIHNYRHGNESGRLFEEGFVFQRSLRGEKTEYNQYQRVGLMAWGQAVELWSQSESRPVVFDVKGAVEGMMARLGASNFQWRSVTSENVPSFVHPGQVSHLYFQGKAVGFIGSLHPSLRKEYKIRHEVALGEFDVAALMNGYPRKPKLQEISKYPAVERDIAFVVPDTLAVIDILKEIKKIVGSTLVSVKVFDIYRGKGVETGYSSMAFRMLYSDSKKTLGEEDLSVIQDKIIHGLHKKLGLSVR